MNADSLLDPPDSGELPPLPAASTSMGLAMTVAGGQHGEGIPGTNYDTSTLVPALKVLPQDSATRALGPQPSLLGIDNRRLETASSAVGSKQPGVGSSTGLAGITPPTILHQQQSNGPIGSVMSGFPAAPGSRDGRSSTTLDGGVGGAVHSRTGTSGAGRMKAGFGPSVTGGSTRSHFDTEMEANRLAYTRYLKVGEWFDPIRVSTPTVVEEWA